MLSIGEMSVNVAPNSTSIILFEEPPKKEGRAKLLIRYS